MIAVHLTRRRADNALMAHLGHLTRLEHLNLFGGRVDRGGLVHLKKLTSLETLSLAEFQDSDDELRILPVSPGSRG